MNLNKSIMVNSQLQQVIKPQNTLDTINILVVEDEPAIAMYISNTLKSDSRYNVTARAFNSKKAIQELNDNKPDLVLLDVNLGCELDGIQIAEIINKQFNIPFLFLTSYTTDDVVERAKHTRPLGYMVKPFSEQDLLTTLKIALFNFKHQSRNKEISLDIINEKIQTPITQREFEILQSLYEGKKNIEIAADNYVSINTVKTHIRNIMSKFVVSHRTELIAKIRMMLI